MSSTFMLRSVEKQTKKNKAKKILIDVKNYFMIIELEFRVSEINT